MKTRLRYPLFTLILWGCILASPNLRAEQEPSPDPSLESAADPSLAPTAEQPPAPPPLPKQILRSKRLQKQLQQVDEETQAIWLGSGKNEFMGLYLDDSSGASYANIVILHDNLQHPNWPGVIEQLRRQLAEHGWNTLSITLPDFVPKPKATERPPATATATEAETEQEQQDDQALDTAATEPPDMMPSATPNVILEEETQAVSADTITSIIGQRTNLAMEFLKQKAPLPIVVLGYGFSASLVAKEAQTMLIKDLNGLVIIDPSRPDGIEGINPNLDAMDLRVPILDITPQYSPRSNPKLRKKNAKRLKVRQYQQRVIRGARQGFFNFEPAVVRAVRGWGETYYTQSQR